MSAPTDDAYAALQAELAAAHAELAQARSHQAATAEVLQVVGRSADDMQPVFDAILDRCEKLFDASELMVSLVHGDGLLHLAAVRGSAMEAVARLFPQPLSETLTARAITQRQTMHIPDVGAASADPTISQRTAFEIIGNFTVVIAPLIRADVGIGGIGLLRVPPKPFSDPEIALLTTFADQAVIAIENARLFRETRDALERQTATAEILKVISGSPLDVQPVYDKILDSCAVLFGATDMSIGLILDDARVHSAAARGRLAKAMTAATSSTPVAGGATEYVIRQRAPLHLGRVDSESDIPWPYIKKAHAAFGDFSFLMAPLISRDRGIGGISLIRQPPRPFSDQEIALLGTFAAQAVIAIENVRLFREIEDKSRQLESANQHKSEFLANMSHELRTPLNAVIGFSEVLLERLFGELNEKQEEYLRDILSSGKHLLSLITDILDLSKIEAGRMELELESFDVTAALGNTLTLIRERAERHGIALSLDASSDLGEIRADQRKLKQIMLNLLSNAVKFTPDGGHITVRAQSVGDALEVAVTDTGIGIAPEEQDTVFEEFRQVGGQYVNKQEGTGLGLALSRRFVELHGGAMRLQSAPGERSTFTFTIPRQCVATDQGSS